jgi:hypothetical protein
MKATLDKWQESVLNSLKGGDYPQGLVGGAGRPKRGG